MRSRICRRPIPTASSWVSSRRCRRLRASARAGRSRGARSQPRCADASLRSRRPAHGSHWRGWVRDESTRRIRRPAGAARRRWTRDPARPAPRRPRAPARSDDARIWSLKGLTLTYYDSLRPEIFLNPATTLAHPVYPVLQPVLEATMGRAMGRPELALFHSELWLLFAAAIATVAY